MTIGDKNKKLTTKVTATLALGALAATSLCAVAGSTASASSAPITLSILTHINPPTQQALATLDAAFEAKYPNIKVQVTAAATGELPTVRDTRMAAKEVDITEVSPFMGATNPSYVVGQPPNIWGELVEAHKFVNLSGQPFLKDFIPSAVQSVGGVGSGEYAIPSGTDIFTGVYYNKAIFAKYGLSVPTTWDALMNVCKVLQAHGVPPFITGQKDGWPAGLVMYAVQQGLWPTMTSAWGLEKAIWTTKNAFEAPLAVQALKETQAIFSYTIKGFGGIPYADAPGEFAAGKAAMTIDGTWSEPTIAQANPQLQFGYFPLPATNNPTVNARWGGKYDIAWSIVSSSQHQAAALDWMAFYSDPANYAKFIDTSGFVPAEPNIQSTAFNNSLHITPTNFSTNFSIIEVSKINAPQQAGFDYLDIAPLGKAYTNMTQLAAVEQNAWNNAG
jgi:raffinose/stachyose/melibiose transport system substrate-binding protein